MAADAKLSVRDLHVYRGASHILQGISLDLGGQPLAIVGRNGMGKTTLCQAIMGLLPERDRTASHARASGTCRRAGGCSRRCRSTNT